MNATGETTMSSKRSIWGRLATLAALGGLALALTGDGARTAASGGIDPLEILKLQVRPNAIIVLDSSGSMREDTVVSGLAAGISNGELVGDDPNSKLKIAKDVLQRIVANNASKISFEFGRYTQNPVNLETSGGRFTNRFYYRTTDPNAASLQINATGSGQSSPGIRRSSTLDTRTIDGTTYYYVVAQKFWNGETIRVSDGQVTAGTTTNPATVTLRNNSGNTRATFTLVGANFDRGAGTCTGFESLVDLAECDETTIQIGRINPFLQPEVALDSNGSIVGYSENCTGSNGTAPCSIASQPSTVGTGVRASGGTPIINSLMFIKDQIWTGGKDYWNTRIRLQPKEKRQRTFVIFVTDGDDQCGSGSLDANARSAAFQAERLYTPVIGNVNSDGTFTDPLEGPTSSVQTFFIAFGGATGVQRSNWIAWGGSGVGSAWSTPSFNWATASATDLQNARNNCRTCRDAFLATDAAALEAALQAAIDQGASQGHFSDTQSVTDSIFEYVDLAGPFDPMDPDTRYDSTLPVLIQATFEMPGFLGHLKAFRNSNDGTNTSVLLWDAADALCWQVAGNRATTLPAPQNNSCTGGTTGRAASLRGGLGPGSTTFTFDQIVTGNLIKRRIYTTSRNGVNGDYTVSNLVNVNANLRDEAGTLPMAPIWPPSAAVDPAPSGNSYPAGTLDTALGFMGLTFAQLQAQYGACQVTTDTGGGSLPSDCGVTSGNPPVRLALARKEARQMILAFTAGAQVALGSDKLPIRDGSGNIRYRARSWILAESTLAAPAVLSPPDARTASFVHSGEWKNNFLKGPRTAQDRAQDGLDAGFGLTLPDLDNDPTNVARDSTTIKPVMSVVYYGTNHVLHALRAGPCPAGVTSCTGEIGGEELWAFVPFDQLVKLRERMLPQQIINHTYVIATPLRFAYVFVPVQGGFSKAFGGATVNGEGVWRAVLIMGRGAGGKHLTALDVTAPGPFTDSACCSASATVALPPIVVWNRGNRDTSDGLVKTGSNSYNNTLADYTAYLEMGETWSVPAIGFVTAANNTTTRKSQGVEFVAWVGSGFSDVSTEGRTFYALDVLTGDVIASHDVGSGTSAANIPNAIVANPAAFAGNNPNVTKVTTAVYFADLHSRIFKFLPDSPGTAPTLFRDLSGDQDQPIANGLAVFEADSDGSGPKPHILVETGNDSRVAARSGTPGFRLYALRDNNGTAEDVFTPIDLPDGFRGTAAPTATFDDLGGLAFFVATKFNPPGSDPNAPAGEECASSFDSLLFALIATTGGAAYDLNASGQDLYATLTGQRITSTSVAFGQPVVDMGLGVDQPPPPPAPPSQETQGTGSAAVSVGVPLVGSGGVSWKVGSGVCR